MTMADEHRRMKISSQLQIRIPADLYQRYGFGSEAIVVPTDTGIELRPVADAADCSADLLQQLLDEGKTGEELVAEFRKRAKQESGSISYHVIRSSDSEIE